jgi:beta-N-acetylhexosaminidase
VQKRFPRARLIVLEPSMPRQQIDDSIARLNGCAGYAVGAFAPVTASQGSVGLGGELPHAIEAMTSTGKPVTLIALGSPYLLRNFPAVTAYLATFSSVPPSEIAAVKALFGEIPIRGRLPVSIPGLAAYGEGIQLGATR